MNVQLLMGAVDRYVITWKAAITALVSLAM